MEDSSKATTDLSNQEQQQLIALCHEAKSHSYSPYSKFRVGAALLTADGTFYKGCNIENASYGLSICAERTALVKAASEGHTSFKAIAVTSDLNDEFITPCGACRQFLIEFGVDYKVLFVKPNSSYKTVTVGDLLPHGFVPSHLQKERMATL